MRTIIGFLAGTLLLVQACKNEDNKSENRETVQPAAKDSLLVTETSWGLVHKNADIESLRSVFGASEVVDSTILGPEGIDTLQVTYVFPGKAKEMIISWKDSFYHKRIGFIETYQPEAPYRTENGLKVGSTFKQLLDANGQPINFSGFGWDYGGHIISYNKGKLDSSHIVYRLTSEASLPDELYGDTELNTALPAVQQHMEKIIVYSITLNLYEH
jgi:hypothetical protein